MLETLIATVLAKFGKEMVDKYFERKDQWDRVSNEIESAAKTEAIRALKYLAAKGELTYVLKDDAGEIVPPASS